MRKEITEEDDKTIIQHNQVKERREISNTYIYVYERKGKSVSHIHMEGKEKTIIYVYIYMIEKNP